MNKEILEKQIQEYKNEINATITNRDKMVGMVNQQETKIQQLMGAVAALERIIREEVENVGNENKSGTESSKIAD